MYLMMQAAMNDKDLLGILSRARLKEGTRSKITKKHLMTPMHAFVVEYDLQIKT